MRGEVKSVSDLSDCDPIETMADLGINTTLDGTVLKSTDPANPCGLVAKRYEFYKINLKNSFFNDTY